MSSRKTTHVVPHDEGWAVKAGGAKRAHRVFGTKAEAVSAGREFSKSRSSEFLIHGQDGKIQRTASHGGDPCPPRDKK